MKRQTLLVLAMFALTALTGVGSVYAQGTTWEARIPFQFSVAGKTLPTGTYSLEQVARGVWLVRNTDAGQGVFTQTIPADQTKEEKAEVVFHRYGHQYFLAQIVAAGKRAELPKSKAELEMARLAPTQEYAYVLLAKN